MRALQNIKLFWAIIFSLSIPSDVFSQEKNVTIHPGIALQLYPAGVIPSVQAEIIHSDKASFLLRLGVNIADRKDYSPHNENEKGIGFGGSLGYRKYFGLRKSRLVVGIHNDVWNMWIDWKDKIETPEYSYGQTYTLVIQPWLEAGYFIRPGNSAFQFGIAAGFGREINVITQGRGVGQGWMMSLSFSVQYFRGPRSDKFIKE